MNKKLLCALAMFFGATVPFQEGVCRTDLEALQEMELVKKAKEILEEKVFFHLNQIVGKYSESWRKGSIRQGLIACIQATGTKATLKALEVLIAENRKKRQRDCVDALEKNFYQPLEREIQRAINQQG